MKLVSDSEFNLRKYLTLGKKYTVNGVLEFDWAW